MQKRKGVVIEESWAAKESEWVKGRKEKRQASNTRNDNVYKQNSANCKKTRLNYQSFTIKMRTPDKHNQTKITTINFFLLYLHCRIHLYRPIRPLNSLSQQPTIFLMFSVKHYIK